MTRTVRLLGVAASATIVVTGCVFSTLSLIGASELPRTARFVAIVPPADLVAPAPADLSTIVVMRDWQEVDTSGSRPRGPRGSSGDNGTNGNQPNNSNTTPRTAGQIGEPASSLTAPRSSEFGGEPTSSTSAPRGIARQFAEMLPGLSVPQPPIFTASTEAELAYQQAINEAANQEDEDEKEKSKKSTKSSKKSIRN